MPAQRAGTAGRDRAYQHAASVRRIGELCADEAAVQVRRSFFAVIAGNGPCNTERLEARVTAWEDGAWFRDGLMAHAKKADARRAAARMAAE